ncbi:MAG: hypothetical protein ACI8XC_004570 [Gammaproteobacteria bacterium]|jgi:hypothetical protein
MARFTPFLVSVALTIGGVSSQLSAHDTPLPDGHITPNINYGFEVVGRDILGGVTDGLYTDVWSHNGFAYVGTFQEPACTRAGVFVVDLAKTLSNYPTSMEGAVVAEIKSAPNTRVNDVKVTTITFQNKTRDVLIITEEKCGDLNGSGKKQLGQGGISLYDVTDPTNPHALKQHELKSEIHNTFVWTADDGSSYLIAVDDIDVNDVIIVDVTKPQSPKEVGRTGIGDWLAGGYPEIASDEQLFTGVFAAPLLHDVWVEKIGGRWQALLSYWDAGFVTLDIHDPFNPTVLGHSTYADPDPVYGTSPAEGNGHAAVYGGDQGQYIWAGDEDFDPFRNQVIAPNGSGHLGTQGDDVPVITPGNSVSGTGVYVGLACDPVDPTLIGDAVAIIQRGDCSFTQKVTNAQAAGYDAAVVFNHSTGCEASVSMIVSAGIPAMFVPRSDGFEILDLGGDYDASTCNGSGSDQGDALLADFTGTAAGAVVLEASFDGWGYYHALNNLQEGTTTLAPPSVPGESPADRDILDIGYLGEIGYFAPKELLDPTLAIGAGDLTMHNVEGDPLTAGDTPSFDAGPRSFIAWYSLGLRAVEYRPGHWHTGNGGVYSWNVHEVGQFIAEDGSNFWGIHVDEVNGEQIILGSDRNTGLWLFKFNCESEVLDSNGDDSGLYCRRN